MLWSSSEIREARKEIGSAQPRWSKKFGALRYIGQIRLGGSIVFHVSQLYFLVYYLPLGGWRKGFMPRASVSSSITHHCVVLVFASLFPYLCLLFSTVDVILIGLDINSVYSLCSFSTHFVSVIKLELIFLFWGSKCSQFILHYLNFYLEDSQVKSSPGFYRFGFLGDHIFVLFIFPLLYMI